SVYALRNIYDTRVRIQQLSAAHLLARSHRIVQIILPTLIRPLDGQVEPLQDRGDTRRRTGRCDPERLGEPRFVDHPDRDRLTVQCLVLRGRFDGVADGVTEIQDRAPAGLALVERDNRRVDAGRPAHQPFQGGRVLPEDFRVLPFQKAEVFRVGDRAVLYRFGETGGQLHARQRSQRIEIGDHEARLVKCAQQILPRRYVDAGLPTDRG